MSKSKKITIVGAGLVGSLLAILLGKRGYKVTIYERRKDLRKASLSARKSINLALSNRGLKPLEQAGVTNQVKKMIIPMKGRMMHDEDNQLTFQRYGKSGQVINSISRGGLNALLMDVAEQEGAKIYFDHQVNEIDFDDSLIQFNNNNNLRTVSSDIIIGADGAYSAVRSSFQKQTDLTIRSISFLMGTKNFIFLRMKMVNLCWKKMPCTSGHEMNLCLSRFQTKIAVSQ